MNNFVNVMKAASMKTLRLLSIVTIMAVLFSSCGLWNRIFPPKYGCPSNGKNIGAERLISDPKAIKEAKKAKKFKS